MRIWKPSYSKPLPPGAKTFLCKQGPGKGKMFAKFKDARGHTTTARLTKSGDGILVETLLWYISFEDGNCISRKIKGFTNREATEDLEKTIQNLLNVQATNKSIDSELQRQLERLPMTIRRDLISFGLLPEDEIDTSRTIEQLVDQFEESLQAQERSKQHIYDTVKVTREICSECRFTYFRDIKPGRVEIYLKDIRQGNRHLSYRRSNAYLKAIKQFCNWITQRSYIQESPLKNVKELTADQDVRRERRALDIDELKRLLCATANGDELYGMNGHERYLLYRFAIESGLRAKEIRSLRKIDFQIDLGAVILPGKKTKNKRACIQYLSSGLSGELKEFMQNKLPLAKAFCGRYNTLTDRTADMLKRDLKQAGIAYKDEDGKVFDFHALRGQCATMLFQAGINLKTTQSIMRHTDPKLTANTYAKTVRGQEAAAIERLPDMSLENIQAVAKTGTDDVTEKILSKSCFQDTPGRPNMANDGLIKPTAVEITHLCAKNEDVVQSHNPLVQGSNPCGPSGALYCVVRSLFLSHFAD